MRVVLLLWLSVVGRADPGWLDREATPLRGEVAFQEADLGSFLNSNPRALVYVWSPHVPASVTGRTAFLAAAGALQIPSVTLLDPQADAAFAASAAQRAGFPLDATRRLRARSLIANGALAGYPAVLAFDEGHLIGAALNGDRGSALTALLRRRFAGEGSGQPGELASTAVPIHVRKAVTLPATDFGYGARPVWGTRWLAVREGASGERLFGLDDGRIAGTANTGVAAFSPDARYAFYAADATAVAELDAFASGDAPFFRDADFHVADPTAGITVDGPARSQYRVLGLSGAAPAVRDYTVTHRTAAAGPAVSGRGQPAVLCRSLVANGVALPVLSKDGGMVAFQADFPIRALLVATLSPRDPGSCTVHATLAAATGKAAFRFDGGSIAFVAEGEAYRFNLATQELTRLTGFTDRFGPGTPLDPEFREDGSLVWPYLHDGGGLTVVELE